MQPTTVLIIAPEGSSRDGFANNLRHAGCRVATAADGLTGERTAMAAHPDVIVLPERLSPALAVARDVAQFVRERGDVVFLRDVRDHFGIKQPYASRLLAQTVLSGKVRNLGHQRGWIANK